MDDQKIRQIVRDEITRSTNGTRFGVQSIPFHTHNGTDSPSIFSPTITYTGFVPYDGLVANTPFVFLPAGWTVELGAGNIYKITHNLSTEYYSVTVCMTGPESNNDFTPITICQDNFFEISWGQVSGGLHLQTDFHFQLVQVNNKRNALPTYTLSGG